jgi:ribosome maturation factor RimP
VDRLIDEALEGSEFFLVESSVKGSAHSPVISVYVDGDSGINIDDCARISRDLHLRIEDAEICRKGFRLNVSSPGLERSLRLPRQFVRNVGRDVRIEVLDDGTGSTVEGRLVNASEGVIRVAIEEGEIALPVDSIKKAVVKAAW